MFTDRFLRVSAAVFSVLLGLVFIFSAIVKLYPVEPFEYTFVEAGIGSWKQSVFIARIFIGLELASGVLLLGNFMFRKFTIPFVAALLMAFNIYLLLQWYKFGNNGNCGCFGEFLQLTPLEGIIKNIVLLLVCGFVYKFHKGFSFKYIRMVSFALVIFSLIIPFVLNPVDLETSAQHYSGRLHYKLNLDLLYNDANNIPPKVELRQGKWIIVFMSLTCPHCRIAAKKLRIMKEKNPALPIHLVLNGDEEQLEGFFRDTRAQNLSWSRFNGAKNFIQLAGTELPAIIWTNNSMVENKTKYIFTHQADIEKWLSK